MEIIREALIDTGKLVQFLATINVVVGFLEYRYGDRNRHVLQGLGVLGPVVGAVLGCIPQCGFSVVASARKPKEQLPQKPKEQFFSKKIDAVGAGSH